MYNLIKALSRYENLQTLVECLEGAHSDRISDGINTYRDFTLDKNLDRETLIKTILSPDKFIVQMIWDGCLGGEYSLRINNLNRRDTVDHCLQVAFNEGYLSEWSRSKEENHRLTIYRKSFYDPVTFQFDDVLHEGNSPNNLYPNIGILPCKKYSQISITVNIKLNSDNM